MKKSLRKLLTRGAIGLASLIPMKGAEGQVSGEISTTVSNSYLVNGFSFNDDPTLFLNGSLTANIGNYDLTFLGIHSRNIKNHFNGKTSGIEKTGLVDLSRDFGVGTASVGGYITLLQEDIFDIRSATGVYSSFTTNTNPELKLYVERGMESINGWMVNGAVSGSETVLNQPLDVSATVGVMRDYFIDKRGLHYLTLDLSTPIYSNSDFSITAGAEYQKGFGTESKSGLEGRVSLSYTF